MRILLPSVLTAVLLSSPGLAQDNPPKADVGKVTSHSQGLHGYIGFGHEKHPPQSVYHAGMGFCFLK